MKDFRQRLDGNDKQPRRFQISQDTVELLKRIGVGALVLGGIGMLVSTVWYGTRIESLTLVEVTVSGGETIDHGLIKEIAERELDGAYLGIVPRRFAWLYPEETMKAKLAETPRIRDIEILRTSGTEIAISFTEYVPYALWCDTPESHDCLFIDQTGFAFASAPPLTGGAFLRFSLVGQKTELREHITDEQDIQTLATLVGLLSTQHWYVSHVEIGQEKDLFLHVVGGGELKVTMGASAEQTAENLMTILASDQFSHLRPGNFQYVDLRFDNKVYINEEPVVEEIIEPEIASTTTDVNLAEGEMLVPLVSEVTTTETEEIEETD